ncbi:MAG TPA: aspartate--tRNA ligase, partial [Nannocystaceae bacterium]|nr:aspartate--tRNA ligase [Nannocystaceae bacterium]
MSSLLETGRTHSCGALRRADVGAQVVLFGWVHRRRDHGGRVFVDLRDREGLTQVVFGPDIDAQAHELADRLRSEFCIAAAGRVIDRGDNANPNLATGAIEIEADRLEIFSSAEPPPFSISDDDRLDTGENLRLRYRYLDLRRPSLQKNFLLRSKLALVTRSTMAAQGFVELETPCMVKYTPGGARNFLVPSRLNPGTFYALAESPQIFKQLFMVAGFEKYFQITRCFRDEDLRNDRQPEFTQIDVELSFATPERVYEAIEQLIANLWKETLGVAISVPLPRMTWAEAMGSYGSDKPDRRFGLLLHDVTEATRDCGFRVFEAA